MRRFVTLAVLLFFAIPFGVSISGCSKKVSVTYCNGQSSGVVEGQTTTLDLEPRLTGISLNQGEIGTVSSPSGKDCKGNSASVSNVQFASSNLKLADINPATGALCGGTWNRQTGGGIPDYTVCTPTALSGTAQITASAEGVSSNSIPVYIHPIVTSIVLGNASTDCVNDPASNCSLDATQVNGCSTSAPIVTPATTYTGNSCLSQGTAANIVARTYAGNGTAAANNISCLVGPLSFSANNGSVVSLATTINSTTTSTSTPFGCASTTSSTLPGSATCATATQPGTSTISAATSNASSTAGFFTTCPPVSIVLTAPPLTAPSSTPVTVAQNTALTLVATVLDKNGVTLTNIPLEYESTNPIVIPAGGNVITPTYPGAAAITAICQPGACNPSPFNEIGLFGTASTPGTGTQLTSNPVLINSTGTNLATIIYIASTQSQYILPIDFTVSTQPAPVRLPYVPNSMVLSEDLSTLYFGTANEIMTYSTTSNSVVKQDTTLAGQVISVSPDNTTIIVTDPVRQLIYLDLAAGGVNSEYGGVATRASWSPDSQTVYITTTDGRLLVHSSFTGWSSIPLANTATDVAVTVPSSGVFLAGTPMDVHTNCPNTTVVNSTPTIPFTTTTTNSFYPDQGPVPVNSTRVAATNDGVHMIAASATALTDITYTERAGGCPVNPVATPSIASTPGTPKPFTGIAPSSISNVLTTSDSAFAFITYSGTGGAIPQYVPATGVLSNVALQTVAGGAAPTAPISGAVSADNKILYVGTSGDNLIHRLARGATSFADTLTPITPALPGLNGGIAPPDLLAQRPRKATN